MGTHTTTMAGCCFPLIYLWLLTGRSSSHCECHALTWARQVGCQGGCVPAAMGSEEGLRRGHC